MFRGARVFSLSRSWGKAAHDIHCPVSSEAGRIEARGLAIIKGNACVDAGRKRCVKDREV
jgi:hypothetical protein